MMEQRSRRWTIVAAVAGLLTAGCAGGAKTPVGKESPWEVQVVSGGDTTRVATADTSAIGVATVDTSAASRSRAGTLKIGRAHV